MIDKEIDLTGSNILIVDDQPLSIKLMEALLNQKGFVSESAKNGIDALTFLEDNTPDLVMLDVMMPGMSGFEVSERMRQNPKTVDIPIIFVTARDDAATIAKCFAAGGNDYAAKPLRIYELLARVKLALTTSMHKRRARESEEALEESKGFLKKIIDENPAQIFVINDQNRLLITNKTFASLLHTTPENLNGKTLDELKGEGIALNHLANIIKNKSDQSISNEKTRHSFEMPYHDPDGNEHWLVCTRVPFMYHNEQCVLGINLDFTNLKQTEFTNKKLEEQLAQSQKMEVIGTLAGGIAHDFNNMLAVILGYSDLAKNTLPEGAKQVNHLNEVIKAGNRAKDLVKQILNFSRQTEIQHVDISITFIIKEVIKMIKSTLPSNINCNVDIDQNARFVRGDQTQMHQILMNLCINANQAMPDSGTLTVKMGNYQTNKACGACGHDLSGDYVHVAISDTGMGMSEQVKKRIFEPYFTTKEVGKGTGMGLAVVHGIINQHNGHICVDSEEGVGSSFHVYLPSSKSNFSESIAVQAVNYSGHESLMVVDDEPMVGELVRETLELKGYTVTLHKCSVEALADFKKGPNKYDLILTDYMMPKMTGDKLAIEIRKLNKEIPIILATGYSNNITKETAQSIGISSFLMKPIIGDNLCKAVRECFI